MPNTSPWRFWLLWVIASTVGGAAVAAVARAASYSVGYVVGDAMGHVLGEAALGVVAMGGLVGTIGAAQWLVLRWYAPWAGWWVLASVAGGCLGGAVVLSVRASLLGATGEAFSGIAGVVVGLSVLGGVEWLVLRGRVSWAAWLALASAAGFLPSGVLGNALAPLLGNGGGFGLVYGAITGAVVVRRSTTAAAPIAAESAT